MQVIKCEKYQKSNYSTTSLPIVVGKIYQKLSVEVQGGGGLEQMSKLPYRSILGFLTYTACYGVSIAI